MPELGELRVGLAHLHLLHTSASLTLNENASPDVRRDFESWFDGAVPEDAPYWTHTDEDVPWHRIVRADGSLAKGERQRKLLEAEGIPFRGDRVDMRAARLPD